MDTSVLAIGIRHSAIGNQQRMNPDSRAVRTLPANPGHRACLRPWAGGQLSPAATSQGAWCHRARGSSASAPPARQRCPSSRQAVRLAQRRVCGRPLSRQARAVFMDHRHPIERQAQAALRDLPATSRLRSGSVCCTERKCSSPQSRPRRQHRSTALFARASRRGDSSRVRHHTARTCSARSRWQPGPH